MGKWIWAMCVVLTSCTPKSNVSETSVAALQAKLDTTAQKIRVEGMYHMSSVYPVGDVDGDHKPDTAYVDFDIQTNKDSTPDYYDCNFRHCELTIQFRPKIPSLTVEQSIGLFAKETQVPNINGGKNIIIFSRWMEGSWKYMSVYTLYRKKWLEIAHAKMFGEEDKDFEHRIIKLQDEYYLLGDKWNDSIGVLQRADTVNIMVLSR